MREDYDIIKGKFISFISMWKSKNTKSLDEIVLKDVKAYFSVVHNKEGGQHTIFGVEKFIYSIQATDQMHYKICNYLCHVKDKKAQQCAEVSCICSNDTGEYFLFVAAICCSWVKISSQWKMAEIRIDIKDYDSPLKELFSNEWYFEEELAVFSATVHLPCILPDIDIPYFKIPDPEKLLTEEEKVIECFSKYNYGVDWLMFKLVKDALSDKFENDDKQHYIASKKFERQRFRYWCSPYYVTSISMNNVYASIKTISDIPNCNIEMVKFLKEDNIWRIISIKERSQKNA